MDIFWLSNYAKPGRPRVLFVMVCDGEERRTGPGESAKVQCAGQCVKLDLELSCNILCNHLSAGMAWLTLGLTEVNSLPWEI